MRGIWVDFDRALVHPAGHDRAFEQVAAVFREDDAFAGRPDLVSGASDALQPTGDRRRALDLDDKVDGAHVDPEFEARGRDQRRQPPGLQFLLDLDALLAGDTAVMRADKLLAREFVESLGQPFAQPPAVGEHDRAAVAADKVQDPRVDRRPDAGPGIAARGRPAGLLIQRQDLAHGRHVVDRDHDLEVERLACADVDDRHRAVRPDPAEEPGDRVERPLRGGQPDPLHRGRRRIRAGAAQGLEPFEAERQVCPAFRAGDRVDLVDDHVLDPTQDIARGAGQHQVQGFRRGDQDIRRTTRDLASILGGRITGAARDRDAWWFRPEALGGQGDPGQRSAQVALDVVGQRLERRHVQDAHGPRRLAGRDRAGVRGQSVQAPQEGRQGLAAPGRGVDQRVLAAGDGGPAVGLCLGRRLEAGPEPVTDGGRERRERIGGRGDGGHGSLSVTCPG